MYHFNISDLVTTAVVMRLYVYLIFRLSQLLVAHSSVHKSHHAALVGGNTTMNVVILIFVHAARFMNILIRPSGSLNGNYCGLKRNPLYRPSVCPLPTPPPPTPTTLHWGHCIKIIISPEYYIITLFRLIIFGTCLSDVVACVTFMGCRLSPVHRSTHCHTSSRCTFIYCNHIIITKMAGRYRTMSVCTRLRQSSVSHLLCCWQF